MRTVFRRSAIGKFPCHATGGIPRTIAILRPDAHVLPCNAGRQLSIGPIEILLPWQFDRFAILAQKTPFLWRSRIVKAWSAVHRARLGAWVESAQRHWVCPGPHNGGGVDDLAALHAISGVGVKPSATASACSFCVASACATSWYKSGSGSAVRLSAGDSAFAAVPACTYTPSRILCGSVVAADAGERSRAQIAHLCT